MTPVRTSLAPLLAIAAAGTLAILAATSTFGIGVSAESETYIAAARNFGEGRGLSVPAASGDLTPLTAHAPLYALLLGAAERSGADAVAAARWMAALLFGALILATGLGLRSLAKRPWLATLGAGIVASSVVALNTYLVALSESLFLAATVAALVLLGRHLQDGDARLLAAASLLSAVALATRYAGAAVVATGTIAILRYARPARRRAALTVFLAGSCAPLLLWLFHAAARAGNPVHRELAFHPLSAADILAAAETISTWFLPAAVPLPLRLAVLAAGVVWIAEVARRSRPGIPCRVLAGFAAAYAAAIAVAKSFFDSAIPMDDRILSPVYVPLLLAAALALDRAASVFRRRWTVAAPGIAIVLIAGGLNLLRVSPCLAAMQREGREYTGASWRRSTLAAWLRSVDPATPIYSNTDSAIRFLRRGFTAGLPGKADPRSGRRNPAYERELERLGARVEAERAAIVYFTDSPVSGRFVPTIPELIRQLDVTPVAAGENWVALQWLPKTASR